MGAQPLSTTAIVLDRAPGGESWTRLLCFSPEHGNLACLQRASRKASPSLAPADLFDELRLSLESRNEGRTWFVREAVPVRKRPGLGGSYETLRHACRLARILAHNPVPEETRGAVHSLLERALTAWESNHRPDAVYFKSLYLLAREEGYPVREQWRPGLEAVDRGRVDAVLRAPVAAQTIDAAELARLTGALETYLREETGIRIEA